MGNEQSVRTVFGDLAKLPIVPKWTDRDFLRHLGIAIGIPGAAAFVLSSLLAKGGRLAGNRKFRKDLEEAVKSENPVISLDPSLSDQEQEEELANLGLSHTAGTVFTARAEPGLLLAAAYLSALGGWGLSRKLEAKLALKKLQEEEKTLTNELEASEYERLRALKDPDSVLKEAACSKRKKPAAAVKKTAETANDSRGRILLDILATNSVEPSPLQGSITYTPKPAFEDALALYKKQGLNNPGLRQAIMRAVAADAGVEKLPDTASSLARDITRRSSKMAGETTRAVTRVGGNIAREQARIATVLGTETGKGLYEGLRDLPEGSAEKHLQAVKEKAAEAAQNVATLGLTVYPVTALTLLIGGAILGKKVVDKMDVGRARRKDLVKFLKQEALENQTPILVEAGSDLPWERGKAGTEEDVPVQTAEQARKDLKEIHI